MRHIISWSGGKDSTATVILFHEHEPELTQNGDEVIILFAEVMFDKQKQISGHNPKIIKFIYEKKKIFESWGYTVEILRAEKDFLDVFYHRLSRSPKPERIGLVHGFVLAGGQCSVKRDCKLKPINDWMKDNSKDAIQYIGIAADEKSRLSSLKNTENTVSILEKYNVTEQGAMEICKKYDMVSPQYALEGQKRDGCWFCPNAKLCEHREIKETLPDAWKRYVALESIPNLAYPKWNAYTDETLHERDKKI